MSIEKARELVAAGATFLDERSGVPANWRTLIDIERFSITDGYRCVLGQLAPHIDGLTVEDGQEPYNAVHVYLWPRGDGYGLVDGVHVAIHLGFYPSSWVGGWAPEIDQVSNVDLNQAWIEALTGEAS